MSFDFAKYFRCMLTLISPELNTKVLYFVKFRKKLNIKNPKKFNEKLLKLRLENYNNNPLVKKCSDKYAVRQYVEEKGCADTLVKLIGAFDNFEDVDWDKLPNEFAMKLNVGCGYNYFCKDKSSICKEDIIPIVEKWFKKNPWMGYAEMQYKDVPKKLIFEELLHGKNNDAPEDYKVYCFHGKPIAVLYMSGRFSKEIDAFFFDEKWNFLGVPKKYAHISFDSDFIPPKPQSLNVMIETAQKLSSGFPFVRVDFYDCDGKAVFGEMTFSPAGGFSASEIEIDGKNMTEFLNV